MDELDVLQNQETMKTTLKLFSLSVITFLTSCATPYGTVGPTGGFQSQRISTDRFIVDFSGNGFTSKDKTNDYAMLRSAEITKEYSFSYFTIEGDKDLSGVDSHYSGSTSYTTGQLNTYGGYGSYSGYTTTTPEVTNIYKPGSQLHIRCYTKRPSGHVGKVYDAAQVIAELKAKHKIQ